MKLAVLHLSDIHIKTGSDPVVGRAKEIASTFFSTARECKASVIVVTGDITFSGDSQQFTIACEFLTTIRDAIQQETGGDVIVIAAPGNHDCKLRPESAARAAIINQVLMQAELAGDPEIIDVC